MNSLEYIDDYFKGRLSGEERAAFEARIHSDREFSEELAFYITTTGVLKEAVEEEKKARFKEIYYSNKNLISRPSVLRMSWSYAIAASLLVVAISVWLLLSRSSGPEKLANHYISDQLSVLPVKMSAVQDSLQKAANLYNDGQFATAGALLESMLQKAPSAIQARIDLGIVYLRLEQYDKALVQFRLLGSDTTLYVNPALFYESLTLMKRHQTGDVEKAKQLLQTVVDRNLDKKEDAIRLLKGW